MGKMKQVNSFSDIRELEALASVIIEESGKLNVDNKDKPVKLTSKQTQHNNEVKMADFNDQTKQLNRESINEMFGITQDKFKDVESHIKHQLFSLPEITSTQVFNQTRKEAMNFIKDMNKQKKSDGNGYFAVTPERAMKLKELLSGMV